MPTNTKRVKAASAWTWKIYNGQNGKWELCYFTFPDKKNLIADGKPSPEAKAVRVIISLATTRKRK